MKSLRVWRLSPGFLLLLVAMWAFSPAQAQAWSNGGASGMGSHRWIFYHADVMAVTQGATWVRLGIALPRTADPDFVNNDRMDHNYDRWHGEHYGNVQRRVAYYYVRAVKYLRAGDRNRASRMAGLMSHYYADACEPLHTQKSPAETVSVHGAYEQTVDSRVTRAGRNTKWVRFDGYAHVADSAKFTIAAATKAHASYARLLSRFLAHGFDSAVRSITATQFNRATNGLADLLVSIQQDAAVRAKSPDVAARVGVAADGSYVYAIDSDRIVKYGARWNSVATTSGLTAGLDETITPRVGAGCVVGTRLYVPVNDADHFGNVHVLVFDTATLQRVASIATSATADISAIAFVKGGAHGVFYAVSAGDSRHLRKFDALTWASLGSLTLKRALPSQTKGLAYRNGAFFASAGLSSGLGRVYRIDLKGRIAPVFTSGLPGIHRGVAFQGKDLKWLVDAGAGNSRVWTVRLP